MNRSQLNEQSNISLKNNSKYSNQIRQGNQIQQRQKYNLPWVKQVFDNIKLYITSAKQLINHLQYSKPQKYKLLKNNFQLKHTNYEFKPHLFNLQATLLFQTNHTQCFSQQLQLVISKLLMFITTLQQESEKLILKIQQSTVKLLQSIISRSSDNALGQCGNYYTTVLKYTQAKYSQLLKETYRVLNLQTAFTAHHNQPHSYNQLLKRNNNQLTDLNSPPLNQQDWKLIKKNRKIKLNKIKQIQREMQQLWDPHQQQHGLQVIHKNTQSCQRNQQSNHLLQMMQVSFNKQQSVNPRKLYMLQPPVSQQNTQNQIKQQKLKQRASKYAKSNNRNNKNKPKQQYVKQQQSKDYQHSQSPQLNLHQLAQQQLQKQFLIIRQQAYKLYEQYTHHQHGQFSQRLKFVKQEQEILESQLEEELGYRDQIRQQYQRVKREIDEIRTINQLIRKRYILRQSIQMDSDDEQ